jgi:hypothetical protein
MAKQMKFTSNRLASMVEENTRKKWHKILVRSSLQYYWKILANIWHTHRRAAEWCCHSFNATLDYIVESAVFALFHAVPTLISDLLAIAGKLHPFEWRTITCAWSWAHAGSAWRGCTSYFALWKVKTSLKDPGYVRRPVRNNYIVLYLKVH